MAYPEVAGCGRWGAFGSRALGPSRPCGARRIWGGPAAGGAQRRRRPRVTSSMNNESEVKALYRRPSQGSRHREGKGHGLNWQELRWRRQRAGGPARGGLEEVIDAQPRRTKVKRRKASTSGEPAPSGEAQSASVAWVYWRRLGREIRGSYLERSVGPRAGGSHQGRKDEE